MKQAPATRLVVKPGLVLCFGSIVRNFYRSREENVPELRPVGLTT